MIQNLQTMSKEAAPTYHIADLIDIDQMRVLMEKFTAATDTSTALLDAGGEVLVATGWQEICTNFHRVHSETVQRCKQSDVALANQLEAGEQFNVYRCLNGLVDVAIPIMIEGRHLANLYIGQFLFEEPDRGFFQKQARACGFDEKAYLAALAKVPVLSESQVKARAAYLVELARFIAELGINKIRIQKLMATQEEAIAARTRDLKETQIAILNMMQDAEEGRQHTEAANTKLNEMMQELKRSNEDLEQFAYVASHDLQEPLRMVSSYTSLLARRYKDQLDEDAHEFIEFAVDGANRMKALIDDLLAYSRVSTRSKSFTPTDCGKVLERLMFDLKLLIEESQATVSWNGLPKVLADETQLTQLFQNLLHNAIKFRGNAPPEIRIAAEAREGEWIFSVHDNGIGIEEAYVERIFVIFQRLHGRDEYPGTGIGLAVCKKIVERHGGHIWVVSKPGEGSTFYFSIPKRGAAETAEEGERPSTSAHIMRNEKNLKNSINYRGVPT